MKRSFHIEQSEFEALLSLLSRDRNEAGEVYERLRCGLARFFRYKGCSDPDGLVDETFNRVAARTHKFDPASTDNPERYFYGFAVLIAKENRRSVARLRPLNGFETNGHGARHGAVYTEFEMRRLHFCLEKLDDDERELIVEYYSLRGQAGIDLRRRLCEQVNCSPTALYVRALRIRKRLRHCIENCTKNKM